MISKRRWSLAALSLSTTVLGLVAGAAAYFALNIWAYYSAADFGSVRAVAYANRGPCDMDHGDFSAAFCAWSPTDYRGWSGALFGALLLWLAHWYVALRKSPESATKPAFIVLLVAFVAVGWIATLSIAESL